MRVIHWLTIAAVGVAAVALLWYMVAVPGRSWSSALSPLTDEDRALRERLRIHVGTIASSEHNIWTRDRLEAAALHIERSLDEMGYDVQREEYLSGGAAVRNVLVELKGTTRGNEIVVVGAHYDSVRGAPGANDNGSGVAAVLELARALRGWKPARTWRLVLFVNEEPPFFYSGEMGSQVHARHARERNERIVAMFSLETIGCYSDKPGSQHYPFPFSLFYPDRGDFLAFVANLGSRALLHKTIAVFRAQAEFPSEGVSAPAFIPGVDWSDQRSFWEQGYRALMVTDTALYRYPYYHTPQDTPDKVDYERLARVTRALERTFRTLDATL
ncbi:MAG TPA: M28 family peptidase [Casimicrobiaceae bacterium]|nr:M28 family peptidase [Casimicrobiaceae bacterium]